MPENYKKPSPEELKALLSPLEYAVTQQDETEKPFDNKYWDHKEEGIYVDVVSGEPLFSSTAKYDSGCGWPSFTEPLEKHRISSRLDFKLYGRPRTEVRSTGADSHLGHVFNDGPGPLGLRYCINSAALRFIPVSQLQETGYEKYLAHFKKGDHHE